MRCEEEEEKGEEYDDRRHCCVRLSWFEEAWFVFIVSVDIAFYKIFYQVFHTQPSRRKNFKRNKHNEDFFCLYINYPNESMYRLTK